MISVSDLDQRARLLGYRDLLDYYKQCPVKTLSVMATELGQGISEPVPPVIIDRALQYACQANNDVRYYTRSSLVRRLNEMLPDGWRNETIYKPELGRALAAWSSRLPETTTEECHKVFTYFASLQAPEGWLPADDSDPIIEAAFAMTCFVYPARLVSLA